MYCIINEVPETPSSPSTGLRNPVKDYGILAVDCEHENPITCDRMIHLLRQPSASMERQFDGLKATDNGDSLNLDTDVGGLTQNDRSNQSIETQVTGENLNENHSNEELITATSLLLLFP